MTPPFKSVSTKHDSRTWFCDDDSLELAVSLDTVPDDVLERLIREAQQNADVHLVGFTPDTLRDLERAAGAGADSSITRDVPLTTGGTTAVTVQVEGQGTDPDTWPFYYLWINRP